jgi:hypothetical protein
MQDKTIPKEDNHVRLSKDLKNKCGVSQLITSIDCDKDDEKKYWNIFTNRLPKYSKELMIRISE